MRFNSIKKILFPFFIFIIFSSAAFSQKNGKEYDPIDLSEFINSAHHWYDIWAPDNIIEPLKEKPRYKPDNITAIADNILLFQKNNGGWPKNYDMQAILTEEQKEKVAGAKIFLILLSITGQPIPMLSILPAFTL